MITANGKTSRPFILLCLEGKSTVSTFKGMKRNLWIKIFKGLGLGLLLISVVLSCSRNPKNSEYGYSKIPPSQIELPTSRFCDTTELKHNLIVSLEKAGDTNRVFWHGEPLSFLDFENRLRYFRYDRRVDDGNSQPYFLVLADYKTQMGIVNQMRGVAAGAGYRHLRFQCRTTDTSWTRYYSVSASPSFIDSTRFKGPFPPGFYLPKDLVSKVDTFTLLPDEVEIGSTVLSNEKAKVYLNTYLEKQDILILEVDRDVELGRYIWFRDQYYDVLQTRRDSVAQSRYDRSYGQISFKKRKLVRKEIPMKLYEIPPDLE